MAYWDSCSPSGRALVTAVYRNCSSIAAWIESSRMISSTTSRRWTGSVTFWYCANNASTVRWSCLSSVIPSVAMRLPPCDIDVLPLRPTRGGADQTVTRLAGSDVASCGRMTAAQTRYATAPDGIRIAYQVTGGGDVDLVLMQGAAAHLELAWEDPRMRRLFERLGSFSRLIRFDR